MYNAIVGGGAEVGASRVGVWIDLYEKAFAKLKDKWGTLNFDYPLHPLVIGDQDAVSGHFSVSFETRSIEAVFVDSSTTGILFRSLGFSSRYSVGLFTQDPILDGDLIYIEPQGYYTVLTVSPHSFGDSFYYNDVKLEKLAIPLDVEDIEVIDSHDESNYGAALIIEYNHPAAIGETLSALGQTFQPSENYVITSAKFYLRRSGIGNIGTAQICETYGTTGDAKAKNLYPLAESEEVDLSTVNTAAFELVTFNFSGANRVALSKHKIYAIVYVAKSGATATNYMNIGYDNTPTHTGNTTGYQYADWVAGTPSIYDTIFYLYGYRFYGE